MLDERLFAVLDEGMAELDWTREAEELCRCKERYEAGQYFVAFIGQYSAGKSYLINNLLERDLLPQGRVETTPILTYIRYGAEEEAELHYFDGRTEKVALQQVRRIMQSEDGAAWDLSEVEHMDVFLDADILRQGMILLDTPGINTLIERHERLLTRSLALASGIVYVTSGTPAAVDVEKLEHFVHDGCSLALVRTHCDEINAAEESYADVVAHEERILSEFGIRDRLKASFYISNLPDSPHFAGIAKIRALLGEKGTDVRASIAEDTAERLRVMADSVRKALEEQEGLLAAGQAERKAEIGRQREALDREVERLGTLLKERQVRLQREIVDAKKRLHEDIRHTVDRAVEQTTKRIVNAGRDVQTNEQMKALIARETQDVLRRTYDVINHHVDPLLKEINGDILAGEFIIPVMDLPEAEHYAAVVEEQDGELDDLRRQLAAMQANRAELSEQIRHADPQKLKEMQEELQMLEQELAHISGAYQEIDPYVPQMIEVDPGDNSGEKLGETIGNILDWAMLILPVGGTKAAATAATKATAGTAAKAMAVVGKAAQVAQAAQAAKKQNTRKTPKTPPKAETSEKTETAPAGNLSKIKTAGATVLQGYQNLRRHAEQENAPTSLLEWLTLEHWGREIGKLFDRPPLREEDRAYREAYQRNKSRMEQELRRKKAAVYQRQAELGVFCDEQAKKKARLESLQVSEQELAQKIAKHEQQWRENAREKAGKEWTEAWASSYREHLKATLTQEVESYLSALPERLEVYQEARFRPLSEKIAEKRRAYDALGELSQGAAEEKLERIRCILAELGRVCA